MRTTGRAALATLVVATGCLLAPVATPTAVAAPAAPAAACSGSTGVTVVVDFGATDGGRHVRCVAGDPSSGLEALGAAGFSYSFVPNKGPFVCAIDRRPDPCNGAPADAYWSYWSASRGGSWSYSNVGAHQRDPAPGSVEGWSFGAGPAPGVAPPATTTTVPPPPPTTRASVPPPPPPPAPSSPPTAAPGTGAPPPAPAADAPPPSDDTTAGATDEPAESADVRTTTTDRTTTTERRPDVDAGDTGIAGDAGDTGESAALETKNTSSSSGIGTGALVALAVTIAIAGSAVWEVRRRRSPS